MKPTRRVRSDGGWMADDELYNGAIHIWPVGDVLNHDLEDPAGDCPCGPLAENGIVLHNSYDGSEGFVGALRDFGESVRALGREIWLGLLQPVGETILCLLAGLAAVAVGKAIERSGEED